MCTTEVSIEKISFEEQRTFQFAPPNEPQRPWKVLSPTQHFSNLFNAYAKAINKAYNRTGGLFQERFGRIPVTSNAHFLQLINYIHHNPENHGFVQDFRDYPYSSYSAMLSRQATHVQRDQVLAWFNGVKEYASCHTLKPDEERIAHLIAEDLD